MITIAEQLRVAWKASGLSLEDISASSGVSRKTVWNMMHGRASQTPNVMAVAQTLKMPVLRIES